MRRFVVGLAAACGLIAGPVVVLAHEGDIFIGRTLSNQLVVDFEQTQDVLLPPVSGLLNGWAADEPGFASLDEDEPGEGVYALDPAARIELVVASVSAAFKAYTPGLADTLDLTGETWTIGGPPFDEHLTWHIDSDDPAFDPLQATWEFGLFVRDTSGLYADSDVKHLSFTNVPDPGALAGLSAVLILCRRRR